MALLAIALLNGALSLALLTGLGLLVRSVFDPLPEPASRRRCEDVDLAEAA